MNVDTVSPNIFVRALLDVLYCPILIRLEKYDKNLGIPLCILYINIPLWFIKLKIW